MPQCMQRRRAIDLILAVGWGLVVLACTGSDSSVDRVKNGHLSRHSGTTVGKAFEHYAYFTNVSWNSLETPNGQRVVEAYCDVDLTKGVSPSGPAVVAKASGVDRLVLHLQFTLHTADDAFELTYGGIRKTVGSQTVTADLSLLQIESVLQAIYANREIH